MTDNDFGFTAVDDPKAGLPVVPTVDQVVSVKDIAEMKDMLKEALVVIQDLQQAAMPKLTKEDVDSRLKAVEELLNPFLQSLMKNPEREYLLWPNRKDQVKKLCDQLSSLVRSNPTN